MRTKNALKTLTLLAALTALDAWIGIVLGGWTGLIMALGGALIMSAVAYWYSGRITLFMTAAHPIPRDHAPLLYDLVEDLATRACLPVPSVYLIRDPSPNAFATGRSPKHAALVVTDRIALTNERFTDRHTQARVFLGSRYVATFAADTVGARATLTVPTDDIRDLHSFRYTIRHGTQEGQNYYWYRGDRDRFDRLAHLIVHSRASTWTGTFGRLSGATDVSTACRCPMSTSSSTTTAV